MVRFASLSRQARLIRLALACVLVIGFFAMTTPAVHASAISETWDGPDSSGWPAQWNIDNQWDAINNTDGLLFSIKSNAGYVYQNPVSYASRHAKALIQTSGSPIEPVFTNTVLDVDVSMYLSAYVGVALLSRYTQNIGGEESYYSAYFGQPSNKGLRMYIARTVNGDTAKILTAQIPVVDPPLTGDLRHLTFSVNDITDGVDAGSVELVFTYTTPGGDTTQLIYNDFGTFDKNGNLTVSRLTGSGQVGLEANLISARSRYVSFDNFTVDDLDAVTTGGAPVPEPASLSLLAAGSLLVFAGRRRRR